ncbi:Xylose isomerase-like TIM barrel [Mesorhizobium albiziae]|uniref:Xylose isomerase-like TIM barrel n=1 Tax=Neomesorhizobium albiziae TaxID=335020 RepID=A0A1I4FU16_9HYPH|nr:hypothetical protein [Mesorhizobium albiziae]GLS32051.1 hypothetical protein GCM10007937_37610 [Mesorhizobium albiziae]SFL21338.1 Xylose isomerase-like TIM barrel [Mesorhizobium albiziae]
MRQASPRFALDHMAVPRLDVRAFFTLARDLGLTEVDIRNDLCSNPVARGMPAADVRSAATEAGVTIISVNALRRFNEWTPVREAEASKLADYAAACGAKTLVLVPVNDGSGANAICRGRLRAGRRRGVHAASIDFMARDRG